MESWGILYLQSAQMSLDEDAADPSHIVRHPPPPPLILFHIRAKYPKSRGTSFCPSIMKRCMIQEVTYSISRRFVTDFHAAIVL